MKKIPWNKDEKLSKTHVERMLATRKITNTKKSLELKSRTCNLQPTHIPYTNKIGNPVWFKDLNTTGKFVCGLCHYHQVKKLKFSSKQDLKQAQSNRMKNQNPMKNKITVQKLSNTKKGVKTGPVHSQEFKDRQKKRFIENNPSKNGIPKEQRTKISKTRLHRLQTGQIQPSVQKKGKDNPRYGIERPEHVRKAISRSNVGKVVSEETKAKIRLKRPFQNNFGQSGSLDEHRLALILQEFQVPYIPHAPLKGSPDFLILPNLIIMVDGDYEHANPNPYRTSEYHEKMHDGYKENDLIRRITAGEKRANDKKITEDLKQQGFVVKRFWGSEIKYETKNVMLQIIEELGKLKI